MHSDALTRVEETKPSSALSSNTTPENMDQLTDAARRLMMDSHLEVSKVRPFFWSLVEAYVDRFNIYPFDMVKALFSYLETNDYPPDLMRELVKKLEDTYALQYGEPMHKPVVSTEEDNFDHEVKELRESLKYAALVDELEEA